MRNQRRLGHGRTALRTWSETVVHTLGDRFARLGPGPLSLGGRPAPSRRPACTSRDASPAGRTAGIFAAFAKWTGFFPNCARRRPRRCSCSRLRIGVRTGCAGPAWRSTAPSCKPTAVASMRGANRTTLHDIYRHAAGMKPNYAENDESLPREAGSCCESQVVARKVSSRSAECVT